MAWRRIAAMTGHWHALAEISVVNDPVSDDIVRALIGIKLDLPDGGATCVLKPSRAPLPFVHQDPLTGGRVDGACEGSFEPVTVGRGQRSLPVFHLQFRPHWFERGLAVQGNAPEVGRRSRSIGDEVAVFIYCHRAVLYQMEGPWNRQSRQNGESHQSECYQDDADPV